MALAASAMVLVVGVARPAESLVSAAAARFRVVAPGDIVRSSTQNFVIEGEAVDGAAQKMPFTMSA